VPADHWRPAFTSPAPQLPLAMDDELLTTRQAARRLGITTASLYTWLAQSNIGAFVLHGHPVTIDYIQGGAKGQGKILLEPREVERLKDLMRVHPRSVPARQPPSPPTDFPGIVVKLGRPR
jgi:hypothetical protein